MYVNINEQFLEKTKEEARKESIEVVGEEDGKHNLVYQETKDEIEELNIEDDKIEISFSNELGYFSFNIPLDTNALEQLLSVTIKRMNKIKTLLESLK